MKISERCSAPDCNNKGTTVYAGEDFGIGRVRSQWFKPFCAAHESESEGYLGVPRQRAEAILDYVRKHPRDSSWPYAIQVFAFGAVAYIQPQGWETQTSRDRRGDNRTVYCAICEEDAEFKLAVKQGWAFPVWTVGDQVATEEICPCCIVKHVSTLLRAHVNALAMAKERLSALGFRTTEEAKQWARANRDVDVWDAALDDFNALRYTFAPWCASIAYAA